MKVSQAYFIVSHHDLEPIQVFYVGLLLVGNPALENPWKHFFVCKNFCACIFYMFFWQLGPCKHTVKLSPTTRFCMSYKVFLPTTNSQINLILKNILKWFSAYIWKVIRATNFKVPLQMYYNKRLLGLPMVPDLWKSL